MCSLVNLNDSMSVYISAHACASMLYSEKLDDQKWLQIYQMLAAKAIQSLIWFTLLSKIDQATRLFIFNSFKIESQHQFLLLFMIFTMYILYINYYGVYVYS